MTCVVVDSAGKPIPNHPITVKLFSGASVERSYDDKTDAEGKVVARDVPWGQTRSIGFDATADGKVFKARKFGLTGETTATLRLVLGAEGADSPHAQMPMDATHAGRMMPHTMPQSLSIDTLQMEIDLGEERLYVNDTVRIVVPAAEAAKPIRLPLPTGVAEVHLARPHDNAKVRMVEGGFELVRGLRAGMQTVRWSYSMPYRGTRHTFVRPLNLPIKTMLVVYDGRQGKATSSELDDVTSQHQHSPGDFGAIHQATDLPAGRTVTYSLTELPNWSGRSQGLAATAVSLVVVVFVLLAGRRAVRANPRGGKADAALELDRQRTRLMVQIAEAEAGRAAGPDDPSPAGKRNSLMGQLRKLTEQLRQAAGP